MVTLPRWLKENTPDDDMIYRTAFWNQVMWVRDILAPHCLSTHQGHDVFVSNTHMSKSVVLPVYYMTINGNSFEFRGNFHDWCLVGMTELRNKPPKYLGVCKSSGFYEGMTTTSAKFQFCMQSREQLYASMLWIVNQGYKIMA